MPISDLEGCLACDLSTGRHPLPGGLLHATSRWRVEHCTGPLGVGTLIVKPVRHVTAVADLDDPEAAEMGPLLRLAAAVVAELVRPEQVYVCLWSHTGRRLGHLHHVVQPATTEAIDTADGAYGPALQIAMFGAGVTPDPAAVEVFADRARMAFAGPRNHQ